MFLELNKEQFSESKYLTFKNLDTIFILFMIEYFNDNKYLAESP